MIRSRVFAAAALAAAVVLFAGGAAPKPQPAPPRIGQQAPDFTLIDQSGKRVRLSDARGEKVVLVFYRGYW